MTRAPKPKFDAEWEPFIPYADESTCPPEHVAALAAVKGKMGSWPTRSGTTCTTPRSLAWCWR